MSKAQIRFVVWTTVLSGLWCDFASAELDADTAKAVESKISGVMSEQQIPGLAISLVVDGEFAWANGFGLADIENDVPVTPQTMFRIASVAKMITATAAMQLVEDGKIDLHKPIQEYCPDFPKKNHDITTHHLLCHQSGIRHWKGPDELNNTRRYLSIKSALRPFKDDELLFEPGAAEEYTTPGYTVVGCVVEGASGQDYDEYMKEHVFEPAGMTSIRPDETFAIIPNRARGYQLYRREVANAELHDTSIKVPGGGLSGSVIDLASFAVAMFDDKLVDASTREEMWTRKTTNDGERTTKGYGCNIGEEKGRTVVWHIGGQAGATGILYLYPDKEIAVALLANLQGAPLFPLASEITDLLLE